MPTLLLEKVEECLDSNGVKIVRYFCEDKQVRFIECSTPKYSKSFIISIPHKYNVSGKGKEYTPIKKVDIDSEQSKYLRDLAGLDIETDIFSVSSSTISLYERTERLSVYKLNPYESKRKTSEVEDVKEEPFDHISKLENDLKDIIPEPKKEELKKEDVIKPKESVPDLDDLEDEEGYSSEEKPAIPNEDEEKIDLEFEEDEEEEEEEQEEIIEEEKPKCKVKLNLDEVDVIIGDVHVCISLADYYKINGETFEKTLLEIYEKLVDNESRLQQKRAEKIADLLDKLKTKVMSEVVEMRMEKKRITSQITRLGMVLSKIDDTGKHIEKGTSAFEKITTVRKKTIEAINELNLELLSNKDSINELMINFEMGLKEMMYMGTVVNEEESDSEDEEVEVSDNEVEDED